MSQRVRRRNGAIRVIIVTPDQMTCELLENAFARGRRDLTVETLTGTVDKITGGLRPNKHDVALICEELEDGPQAGFKVLQKMQEMNLGTAVIMLLKISQPDRVVRAFRDGARGIFYRNHSMKSLSKCIQSVHEGQIWASNEDQQHLINALTELKPLQFNNAHGIPLLTRREEEVVRLVSDGLKNREVAQRLNVAEHSIRNYLYRIYDKLGVSTRVELILYAFSRRDQRN